MKILSKITLLIVLNMVFFSCSQEEGAENIVVSTESDFSFEESNIEIDYISTLNNNQLFFELKINNSDTKKSINETFNVDLNKSNYSKDIIAQIAEKQKRISDEFTVTEINEIVLMMNEMVVSKTENMSSTELRSMKTQGLFISNSLIKSISRLISNNNNEYNLSSRGETETTNTVYEGYYREMSSFAFNEDININVEEYIIYIDENPEVAVQKGFTFVRDILKSKTVENISLAELQSDILEFTIENPDLFEGDADPATGFRWPRGSDHGCCGNYSGPCYFWHPVCWVHDKLCSNCSPRWFCFSGCVPD